MTARPYGIDIPLRWSDMDAYGHVNNVQYLRLLEDARIKGIHEWFHGDNVLLHQGVLVARNEIEYLAPLSFRHAPVHVDMWVSRLGGAGFDLGYQIRDPADWGEALYARAETTLVSYDFAARTPRRLVASERDVLTRVLSDPVPFRRRARDA